MRNLAEIKKVHQQAYFGETDYIPLNIWVDDPALPQVSRWERTMNPEKALGFGLESIRLSREVGSDWIPTVTNFYQDILIPSLFGAEIFDAKEFNPMPRPFINDIHEVTVYRLEKINLQNSLMEQAINHFVFLRKNVPDGIAVLAPTITSPLDYAVNMRGGDFFTDLIDEPEICRDFLMLITELIVKKVKLFKELAGEAADSYITIRGHYFPGLRLACDSMVNLSPKMIQEFMLPVFDRLAQEFKRLLIHYCCTPAPSTHVLPVLMEVPYIYGVDNWQGYHTFFRPESEYLGQEKLSIATDIAPEQLDAELKLPFFTRVNRRNGRGILVSTKVKSVDEGKRLYEDWRKRFD